MICFENQNDLQIEDRQYITKGVKSDRLQRFDYGGIDYSCDHKMIKNARNALKEEISAQKGFVISWPVTCA